MAHLHSVRPRRIYYEDVTIAWVCAIVTELQTARATLDEEFDLRAQKDGDPNTYVVGRIGPHNIAMACLDSSDDPSSATSTAVQLLRSFPNIQFGLMVGIGGGVTYWGDEIRLGDVVVAHPKGMSGGIVAFDVGKAVDGSTEFRGHFNHAPDALRSAANTLDSEKALRRYNNRVMTIMEEASNALADAPWPPPDVELDILYCAKAAYDSSHDAETCPLRCDPVTRQARRHPRISRAPRAHRGLIATSHKVIADGRQRDGIVQDLFTKCGYKVLCFEMEASSLANKFPCLIIRGISDYADSSKNDTWQRYAALSAAAYAKELLLTLLPVEVEREPSLLEQSKDLSKGNFRDSLYVKVMEGYAVEDPATQLQEAKTAADAFVADVSSPSDSTQGGTTISSAGGSIRRDRIDSDSQAGSHNDDTQSSPLSVGHSLDEILDSVSDSSGSPGPGAAQKQPEPLKERIQNYRRIAAKAKMPGGTLHIAAEHGDLEAIEFLHGDLGFDINVKWLYGTSLLHSAARGGSVATVDRLLQLGQDLAARDSLGGTALHYAAGGGHVALLDHLLTLKQDINARYSKGKTVLHIAAFGGHIAMLDRLLQLGQDLEAKDNFGETVLHHAARGGHVAMLDHLLHLGQDLYAETPYGWTVLICAAIEKHIAMLDHVLQLGFDINRKSVGGLTVLHTVARSGDISVLDHLLQQGMDLEARDSAENTALHVVASKGHIKMVEHLAKLGLDVFAKNAAGKTPRQVCGEQKTSDLLRQLEREARRRQSQLEAGSTMPKWKFLGREVGRGLRIL